MKFVVMGYRAKISSTERIERELVSLGGIIDEKEPEFLIDLTGPFWESEDFYNSLSKKPIRLYCLLDIDIHKPIEWYGRTRAALNDCEIPCVISRTVANQVKNLFNFERDLNIVHHPIRRISYLNSPKTIKYLWSGRISGWNKRFDLAIETLKLLNIQYSDFVIAGTEKPNFSCFHTEPPPDDILLNEIFNSSKFLLSPSSFEGQNCGMVQCPQSHTYPILNIEAEVVREFGLERFAAEPSPQKMVEKIREIERNPAEFDEILHTLRPQFIEKFDVKNVAKRIISLYESIR